ncbi:MAG: hypothetical protein K6T17_02585 [Fimbriimonadales bacterium]|nr:hypothetical protein [Fimbriimonadales bacterium]
MSSSKNTFLIVILVVVALVLALCIVCVLTVPSALRQWAEGGGVSQLVETQMLGTSIQSALKKYLSAHHAFPENLDALKDYMDAETLSNIKEKFQYLPPQKEAPGDTVIVHSHDIPSFEDSYFRVEIHKDLSLWLITKQKLAGDGKPPRNPFSKG